MWFIGILLLYTNSAFTATISQCQKGQCEIDGVLDIPEDILIDDVIIEKLSRNAVRDPQRVWPNGIVPYQFQSTFSLQERQRMQEAMKGIESGTCIKFVEVKKLEEYESSGYLLIVHGKQGCNANLGYWPTRGISFVTFNPLICFKKLGTIQHELLHVLGLKHEHARPDRDDYIEIVEKNIQKDHLNNFIKADEKDFQTFDVPYDYESVMHYGNKAFSKNDKDTIIPKNSDVDVAKMGQRRRASPKDIEKINKLYGCPRN